MSTFTDEHTAAELREIYGVTDADLDRIRTAGRSLKPRLPEMVSRFYVWLKTQPDYEEFFPDEDVVKHVADLQQVYWGSFLDGVVDEAYIRRRVRTGETHARIDLPLNIYLASMNTALKLLTIDLRPEDVDDASWLEFVQASTRLCHLDTAVVVRTFNAVTTEFVAAQSKALMEMSTPVTQLWEGILMLPVVGLIDSKRAQDIMNAMLRSIADTEARHFILDISGVGVVDTAVANHLIKITKATALMGCQTTISGISPSIAQTIVDLGIDVGEVRTTGTMRDALDGAFQRLGLRLVGIQT
jgi:rsbT co-antagonist protein RsbR